MTSPAIHAGLPLPMTVYATLHGVDRPLADSLHLFHLAMAGCTSYVCGNVALVAEVNKIREIVYFEPFDRTPLLPILAELLDSGRLFTHVFVAAHTELHGRDPGHNRPARIDMAIKAVDLVIACMDSMAEFNWLNGRGVGTICKKGYRDRSSQNCRYRC